ncbi:MAG TPA: hypothetical protein PKA90_13475 [Ignavibacteria bacterium]|nr:hypothetical protein [Ignavibacteria bacterium]HMR41430.1 hypothetical protein [Ignavibacteria bacterium]
MSQKKISYLYWKFIFLVITLLLTFTSGFDLFKGGGPDDDFSGTEKINILEVNPRGLSWGDEIRIFFNVDNGVDNSRLFVRISKDNCLVNHYHYEVDMGYWENEWIDVNTNNLTSSCTFDGTYSLSLYIADPGSAIPRYSSEETALITFEGGIVGPLLTAEVESDYMNDGDYQDYTTDMIGSTHETFNHAPGTGEPRDVMVSLNYSTPANTNNLRDFTFDARIHEFGTWKLTNFDAYANGIKNHNNCEYHLITARRFTYITTEGVSLLEFWRQSHGTADHPNYSYVFIDNIDIEHGIYNQQSCYNLVANHELCHQIGNVWGDDAHVYHSAGDLHNICALNHPTPIYNADPTSLTQLNAYFRICARHVTYVRNSLDSRQGLQTGGEGNFIDSMENPRPNKLITELKKSTYKVYEPIDVLLKFTIYKDEKVYKYDLVQDLVNFEIVDENGVKYNFKEKLDGFRNPFSNNYYDLKFGDTLTVLRELNEYGKKISNPNNIFFNKDRFFPVGNYKVFVYTEDGKFKSDYFEFEIIDLDNEDMSFLNATKNEVYLNTLQGFEQNDFLEYAHREKVRKELINYTEGNSSLSKIVDIYKDYLIMFPNSFYNVHYIPNYLRYQKELTGESTDRLIEDLKREFPNSFIGQLLKNKVSKELIRKTIE